MALTRNKSRTYSAVARRNSLPMSSASVVYEGSAIGINAATGRARALVAGDLFAGFAASAASSVGDATGADPTDVPLIAEGEALLAVSAVTATDLGASVFAADDDTFALEGSTLIGEVLRVPAAGQAVVAFVGGRNRLSSAQVSAEQALAPENLITDAAIPSVRSASISLPSSIVRALWFPLDEGIGTSVVDSIAGKTATVSGTVTNLWDNSGCATFNADTRVVLRNDTYTDDLWRLDTLNGSILVGVELEGGTPSSAIMLFGYGDAGVNSYGGIAFRIDTNSYPNYQYCAIGGSTFQVPGQNLASFMSSKEKRYWQFAIHRINGKLWFDCYEGGWHHYSSRPVALESAPYTVATTVGMRIGCRPVGTGGSGGNYVGAGLTLPKMSNFYALRIDADKRAYIPKWTRALSESLPYGLFPELS